MIVSTNDSKYRLSLKLRKARLEERHKTPTIYLNKYSHRRRSELRFSIKAAGPGIGFDRTH